MRFLPILALLTFVLAGCTGLPPGSADVGDEVTVEILAVDPDTGHPVGSRLDLAGAFDQGGVMVFATQSLRGLLQQTLGTPLPGDVQALLTDGEGNPRSTVAREEVRQVIHDAGLTSEFAVSRTFVVGDGDSGFSEAVERRLVGVRANETVRVDCTATACAGQRRAEATLGPFELERSIGRNQFESALGPAEEGMQFPLNDLYDARVTNVTDTEVRYDILATDGQRDPAGAVGAIIVTRIAGAQYTWVLEPDTGATFPIAPPQFNQQTPLGLEPGVYKTDGKEGDELVYSYLPFFNTDLFSGPYVLEVTVTSVDKGEDAVPTEDFGKRDSPVLRDQPKDTGPGAGDHDHGDHQH